MPYDVLVKEVEELTDEQISEVLDYIAFIRFRAAVQQSSVDENHDGWIRIPGKHSGLFEVLSGFDDPIEGFEEYM